MKYDILSWYRRSEIEETIEKRLAKYGLCLTLPQTICEKNIVLIIRKIERSQEKSQNRIIVSREFYSNSPPKEDIAFELEGDFSAGIIDQGTGNGYTAFCDIYRKNKNLLNNLKYRKEFNLFVVENLKESKTYGIKGNINKFAEILVDYWAKQHTNEIE